MNPSHISPRAFPQIEEPMPVWSLIYNYLLRCSSRCGCTRFPMLAKRGQCCSEFPDCFASSYPSPLLSSPHTRQARRGSGPLARCMLAHRWIQPTTSWLRLCFLPLMGAEMWNFLLCVGTGFHKIWTFCLSNGFGKPGGRETWGCVSE